MIKPRSQWRLIAWVVLALAGTAATVNNQASAELISTRSLACRADGTMRIAHGTDLYDKWDISLSLSGTCVQENVTGPTPAPTVLRVVAGPSYAGLARNLCFAGHCVCQVEQGFEIAFDNMSLIDDATGQVTRGYFLMGGDDVNTWPVVTAASVTFLGDARFVGFGTLFHHIFLARTCPGPGKTHAVLVWTMVQQL